MKDALRLGLPSWPPQVHFPHRGRPTAVTDDADGKSNSNSSGSGNSPDDTDDTDPEANKSSDMLGSEPSYQRLQQSPQAPVKPWFKQRHVRWTLSAVLVFGIVTIILLSTLLTRHTVGGLDTLFKVCSNYKNSLRLRQTSTFVVLCIPGGQWPWATQYA